MSRFNSMIPVSLVIAMTAMLAVIYFSFLTPSRSVQPVKLVTGEWAPYTGEDLADYGIVTAIVTHILGQMGYRAEYEFMPWSLGESLVADSQRNDSARGIFPYMKTAEREQKFYFSRKIIDIDYAVFYHKARNPNAAKINSAADLKDHRIIALQGYDYHPDIKPYLPAEPCRKKDTLDGFRHLANPRPRVLLYSKLIENPYIERSKGAGQKNSDQVFISMAKAKLRFSPSLLQAGWTNKVSEYFVYYPDDPAGVQTDFSSEKKLIDHDVLLVKGDMDKDLMNSIPSSVCQISTLENALQTLDYGRKPAILLEALDVGQQLLSQRLPQLLPDINRAEYMLQVGHAVMFSRNNPNNLALRDEFDRRLSELQANSNAYNAIINSTRTRIDMARAILIEPFDQQDLVAAYVYDEKNLKCDPDKRVYLPRGSKAIVHEWHSVFLHYQQVLKKPMLKIRLLNGPMASMDMSWCVDGRTVTLP